MKKYLVCVALLACAIALVSLPVAAQNSFLTNGVKAKPDAADPNIKHDEVTNSPDQKVAPPQKKGGPASKAGYTCDGHIDNRTSLYVRYYMNGDLEAIIGPYGDYYPAYTHGNAVLYAKAVFEDGSVLTFGPRTYSCVGSDFTWSLTP